MNSVDKEFIKKIIKKELLPENRNIEIKESFSLKDLNLDSFSLLSIASEIEDEYNIKLIANAHQIEEMKNGMKTFEHFIDFLNQKIKDATKSK